MEELNLNCPCGNVTLYRENYFGGGMYKANTGKQCKSCKKNPEYILNLPFKYRNNIGIN